LFIDTILISKDSATVMRLQFQKCEIGKPNYPALAAARMMHRKRILYIRWGSRRRSQQS